MSTACVVSGCGRGIASRATGLCKSHQQRLRRNPNSDVSLPINSPALTMEDRLWQPYWIANVRVIAAALKGEQ